MRNHHPRKRFGQHFLHDPQVIRRIVAAFDPHPGERIIEIGPGLGALTYALLSKVGAMHAVELDRDLARLLEEKSAGLGDLTIHQADALTFNFCSLFDGTQKLRIIGNLPYNISTPLLFHLLDQVECKVWGDIRDPGGREPRAAIRDMCFMLQKEVVDRLCAQPGSKDYGRLSVMIQWRCQVKKLLAVGPGAFSPPPKVDSAVVRLVPHITPPVAVTDINAFTRLVRLAFAHRRKSLRNALKGVVSDAEFATAGVDPGTRAEQLTLEQFARLDNTIKK